MEGIKDFLEKNPWIIGLGIAAVTLEVGGAFGSVMSYKAKQLEAERLKEMPDSYWMAEKAKAEAAVKQHELDIALKERLELDARDRAALERAAKLEFERTAPPEYWEAAARKAEAAERGKTERENAKRQAEAIKSAAREISLAVKQ